MSLSPPDSLSIEGAIAAWNGKGVFSRYVASLDAWIFLALHDDTLGPCTGGTRIMAYGHPAAGLRDAMRLAEGMTEKWAVLGQPYGGGKGVLALSHPLSDTERQDLLAVYGSIVETLRGAFATGEDLGTSTEDMVFLRRYTRFVHGFDASGRKWDPSPYTARGVLAAIEAGLAFTGGPRVAGSSVIVQGVGHVGMELARMLHDSGARVAVSDISDARVDAAVATLGVSRLEPAEALTSSCDVLAPCAVGGVLDGDTISNLKCRIVAGSANNQLAEPADAERLRDVGILYLPDYVVNGGGAMAFALMAAGTVDPEVLEERVLGIGDTIHQILQTSLEQNETPVASARRLVEERLAAAGAH